jgi:hypothetical protein
LVHGTDGAIASSNKAGLDGDGEVRITGASSQLVNVDLDGETGTGALTGIDVASCERVFVANERGRSILAGNPPDSPFSNVGDNFDVKAVDTDPVLLVTGKGLSKTGEEESEGASDQSSVTSYQLERNYPNPFNPSTVIHFALPEAGRVTLAIYSVTGQLVRELVNGEMGAGRQAISWSRLNQAGEVVAAGIYFYQMMVTGKNGEVVFSKTQQMAFLK